MDQCIRTLLEFVNGRKEYNDIDFCSDKYYRNNAIPLKVEGIYSFDEEKLCHDVLQIACNVPSCLEVFDNVLEYESHYNSKHKYNCSECKKLLPSNHLLDLHICETHDSFFAVLSKKKASFSCYIETCLVKFWNAKERREHCIEQHQFPPNFRFEKMRIKNKKEKISKNESASSSLKMNEDAALDEGMSVCSIDENRKRMKGKKPKKKLHAAESVMCVDDEEHVPEKPIIKSFTFGHFKNRGFAKSLTKMVNNVDTSKNVLEDEDMIADLLDNLPK